jgi:hypothetical protein
MVKTPIPVREPPADAVWQAEFASMLGVKPATLKHYVQQVTSGSPGTPVGFPLPDGKWLREVPATTEHQPTRRVWSTWWARDRAAHYAATRLPVGYQGPRKTGE